MTSRHRHGFTLVEIAIATGGAWVFYFADAPTLAGDLVRGEAPFVAYATIGVLTATTFVLGGFMREQVCIYMCPWPRIQASPTCVLSGATSSVTKRPRPSRVWAWPSWRAAWRRMLGSGSSRSLRICERALLPPSIASSVQRACHRAASFAEASPIKASSAR